MIKSVSSQDLLSEVSKVYSLEKLENLLNDLDSNNRASVFRACDDPYLVNGYFARKGKDLDLKNDKAIYPFVRRVSDPLVFLYLVLSNKFDFSIEDYLSFSEVKNILTDKLEQFKTSPFVLTLVATHCCKNREKITGSEFTNYDEIITFCLRHLNSELIRDLFDHLEALNNRSFYLLIPFMDVTDKLYALCNLDNTTKAHYLVRKIADLPRIQSTLPLIKDKKVRAIASNYVSVPFSED